MVYQLDAALESVETQKHGLVFIYDMSDSKYQNFDYDLSQKILTLLKVSFTPVHARSQNDLRIPCTYIYYLTLSRYKKVAPE